MTLEATVINGQIVLDRPQPLPEGAKVKVEIRQLTPAQEEWLRRLRGAATDCGVSLSDEALSREELYD
jgi:predicted DNA-binding antitoxin AbrB/MazE fold protein